MHPPILQPCPMSRDTYTVKMDLNSSQLVIAGRDNKPINAAEVEAVLGEREPAVIWYQHDKYGFLVFGPNYDGESLAQALCDQLNACASEDATRDAELIDAAADVAERSESAEAAAGLTPWQRRGVAAYQRAVVAAQWYFGDSAFNFAVGERVTIGAVPLTDFERGALCALDVPYWAWGKTATVILPAGVAPMVVLTDDRDEVVALPSFQLYVRRAPESAQ